MPTFSKSKVVYAAFAFVTRSHLNAELDALVERLQSLLAAGWTHLRIITDHGWLLLPGGLPKVEMPHYLVASKWSRCATIRGESATAVPEYGWFWNQAVRIAIPHGIGAFTMGNTYAHGGLSPQECITPDLRIERTAVERVFIKDVLTALDVSINSPISLGAEFRNRLNAHNQKIRELRRHGFVWEVVIQLRTSILSVKSSGKAITAANVWKHGIKSGAWLLPRTRQIYSRMASMMNNNKPLRDPALRVPPDIRAFLDWRASKKGS